MNEVSAGQGVAWNFFLWMGRAAGFTQWTGMKSALCLGATGRATGRLLGLPVKILWRSATGMTAKHPVDPEREIQARLILARNLTWLGDLLAGVAHELNSPLTVVMGTSDIGVQSNVEGETSEFFQRILSESYRMRDIVCRFPQSPSGGQERRAPTDLRVILEHVVEMATVASPSGVITVEGDFSREPHTVVCRPDDMRLVFLNLLQNAVQAIDEDRGSGTVTLSSLVRGNRIVVTVKDDGPGIHADELPNIFAPFFTTRREKEATGIGLSICRCIVQDHQGDIRAESEPGGGARFVVELPTAG
ncbi:MAG: sensor histidine kinase [Planctomycetota bacterium]|jgi:signal transduction histidine kinase